MPQDERRFETDTVNANRAERQGLGVGQRELDAARDPARPEGADQYDFDGGDNPQEDGGDPSLGAQHGVNHTRRGEKAEAQVGQGPKTRARNKEIVNGRLG